MARRRFDPLTAFGIPLVGGALLPLPKYIWYVDPDASTSQGGDEEDHPFNDLQDAIDASVADRGDLIIVKPGYHATTTMLDFNKRGITVVAQAFGANQVMAGESFTAYAASSLDSGPVATITDPCRIIGMGFAGRDTTTESLLIDCEESGGFSGGFVELLRCRFSCWYGAMTHGIKQIGGSGNRIIDCTFDGLFGGFGTSAIGFYNDAGGLTPAFTEVIGCRFSHVGSGKHAIVHDSSSTPLGFLYAKNYLLPGFGDGTALGKFLDNNNVAATGMCAENFVAPLANQGAAFENLTNSTIGFANNHYEEA